jgi:osomolarity two-component system sensor histidine kinase NIK1
MYILKPICLGTLNRPSRVHAQSGSLLIVPPGPLATAPFESGMRAAEKLRLLKVQVQDVARVCNAAAHGDLSQKITVPVQGGAMI